MKRGKAATPITPGDGFDASEPLDPVFVERQRFLARARILTPQQQERMAQLVGHPPIIIAGVDWRGPTRLLEVANPTAGNSAAQRATRSSLEYLQAALTALAPWAPTPLQEVPLAAVDPAKAEAARGAFAQMETTGYTLEEKRRLLLPDFPFLSREYVAQVIRPSEQARAGAHHWPEDWGEERHFHLAEHLAYFLMSVPAGTNEASAIAQFMNDPRINARGFTPVFTADDLHRLQVIYPFVPRWPNGVKSETDASLAWSTQPAHLDFLSWTLFQAMRDQIAAGASIPLTDPILRETSILREPPRLLARAQLNEVTGVFSDSIPRMYEHFRIDGLAGSRVRICGKHYSAAPVAVDLLRRVFGARVDVVKGDDEVAQWVLDTAREAVAKADGPVIEHVEGVIGVSEKIAELQRQHPDVPIIQISHSTSDARDLVKNVGLNAPHLVQLMGLSTPKEVDENERFRLTFTHLILDLTKALSAPLYEYAFAVVGYGKIIGPAAAAALDGLKISNRLVIDRQAERRAVAAKSHPVAESLAPLAGQAVVVLSGTGTQALGPQELAPFAGKKAPLVLVSLGSGRREFDMSWVTEQARLASTPSPENPSPLPAPRIIGTLGREPILEYHVRIEGKALQLIIPADGYVANLAQLHPTPSPYAATTPLLILEAMRQGVFRRCVLDERGTKPLDCLSIDIHQNSHGTSQRLITLYDYVNTVPEEKRDARSAVSAEMFEYFPNAAAIVTRERGWWNPFVDVPANIAVRRVF